MQARTVLWFVILAGIAVHSIVLSNINIALPAMVQRVPKNVTAVTGECVDANKVATNTSTVTDDATGQESSYKTTKQQGSTADELFPWTEYQQNLILSSHFVVFGLSQLFGGFLCHRYGAKKVWGLSNLALGLSAFLSPSAAHIHYIALVALRMIQGTLAGLGIAGGPAQLIAKWVPPHDRGKYMITFLGMPLGIALSYSAYGYLIYWTSWEYTFYTSGIVALIWCMLFNYLVYDVPSTHPRISAEELKYIKGKLGTSIDGKNLPVPWKAILTSVPFLVNLTCKFGAMWGIFTLSVFIPTYFSIVHGFPIHKAGMMAGLPFVLKVAFAILFSTFTDYLILKEALSKTNARKLAVLVSGVFGGLLLICVIFVGCNRNMVIVFLTSTMTLNGGIACGIIPNLIDMSPNYSGVLEGIAGFVTSFTGFLAPFIVGYVVRNNTIDQWNTVFVITGSLYVVPGILFLLFADSRVQPWNNPSAVSKECSMFEDSEQQSLPNSSDKSCE